MRFQFRHLPELDGLRGIAILLVIVGHVLDHDFAFSNGFGELGVLVFFVLSGFLITGVIDREEQRTGSISLKAFYLRRALRILPAFTIYLAVLTGLMVTGLVTDTFWYPVIAALLFLRNIWGRGVGTGHIWSLSLEEQFYTVWPYVRKRFGALGALRIGIVVTLGVTGFRMLCMREHWLSGGFDGAYHYRPWFRFDAILIGAVCLLWMAHRALPAALSGWFRSPLLPLASWSALGLWTGMGPSASPWHMTVQTALVAVILVHLVAGAGQPAQALFRVGALRWIGRVSYSWYLWQQLFTYYSDPRWGLLVRFPFDILASLAAATASYYIIERPFLTLKDRLDHRPALSAPAVV